MGLVDYSDSEDDEPEPAVIAGPSTASAASPAVASAPPPPAPRNDHQQGEPTAKRARKNIDLSALLKKNAAEIDMDDASKLPPGFFDSKPREQDAGEADGSTAPKKGWAALSAMLPPPKNAPKTGKSSVASLYDRAKPLHRKPDPASSSSTSAAVSDAVGSSASSCGSSACSTVSGAYGGGASSAPGGGGVVEEDEDEEGEDVGIGLGGGGLGLPQPTSAELLPRLRLGLYDQAAQSAPKAADTSRPSDTESTYSAGPCLTYEVPAGPSLGPASGPYPGLDDGAGAYAEAPAYYEGMDEGNTVSVSHDDLRKAMGAQKQYDFMVPPPKEDVKIASTAWNRQTGSLEQRYQASSTQKRKHQINALAADAAVRSAEVLARGSKGLKSKRETAAKYGW